MSTIKAYLAKDINARDLARSLDLSKSQTYKIVNRYRQFGEAGLITEHYHDFRPTLACEKLESEHGIMISEDTTRLCMKAAGLWIDRFARQLKIYQPRKPRPRLGELIQVDGSYHRWFGKRGPAACLLVFIDNATSRLMKMIME